MLIFYQIILSAGIVVMHCFLIISYMKLEKKPSTLLKKSFKFYSNGDHTIQFCLANTSLFNEKNCPCKFKKYIVPV